MSRSWKVFLVVYLGSVATTLNQFKVPPVMDLLMEEFNLTVGVAGWMMSIFALAGILLALPVSIYLKPVRMKAAGVAGLSFLTLGALLGTLSTQVTMLLVGRLLEGIGLLTMGVVSPTLISLWFPKSKRGLPMGIWATWVPVGFILLFNLANPLCSLGGWRAVWLFGLAVSVLSLAAFILVVDLPSEIPKKASDGLNLNVITNFIKNREIWYLCFMFGALCFIVVGYGTWAPTYLKQSLSFSAAMAAFYTSLLYVGSIPSSIAAGWLINRFNKVRLVYLLGFAVFTITLLFAFNLTHATVPLYMFGIGLISGFIPTATFVAAPRIAGHYTLSALSIGFVLLGQNIGSLLGPVSLGGIMAMRGEWGACVFILVPVSLLGLFFGLLTKENKENS